MAMAEAPDAERLKRSPSGPASGPETRRTRIDRRELRLLCGMVVSLIGAAVFIASQVAPLYSITLEGWLVIAGSAFIAVGLMLIGSGLIGRAARLGDALYVATPGGLLAAVGFTVAIYLQPAYIVSQYAQFTWIGVAFLGLLWIIVGPIFVYRMRTRLWAAPVSQNSKESAVGKSLETDRTRSGVTIATWFLVAATLATPVINWLLTRP